MNSISNTHYLSFINFSEYAILPQTGIKRLSVRASRI